MGVEVVEVPAVDPRQLGADLARPALDATAVDRQHGDVAAGVWAGGEAGTRGVPVAGVGIGILDAVRFAHQRVRAVLVAVEGVRGGRCRRQAEAEKDAERSQE
jgi:hypothetical protein